MATAPDQTDPFQRVIALIVSGDNGLATDLLTASPQLVRQSAVPNQPPSEAFYEQIAHAMYAGDTALHMAAAAKRAVLTETLIALGADVSARNRRGTEPLHYATDAGPSSPS